MASLMAATGLAAQAQTTTPNVKVDILGVGAEFLLGGDLTDANNDGLDELGGATDPSWDWAEITSSHEPDFQGGENSFNIFDNKVGGGNDKWCCDDPTPDVPVWVAVKFKQPLSLTHFTVTSGNDTPGRDPVDWAIQGSNDGTTYKDIYRFVDTVTPWGDTRNQVVKFTLPSAAPAYTYIRYIAWETPANLHQLNEIEYFGGAGASDSPLKKGLMAYWNFDDGGFKDAVGKFDGTANGSEPIASVTGKPGFGKAIKMNGEDQFIEITGGEPDDLAFAGGSMSVAGWFKVDAFDTDWQALIAKGEGSNWRIHRRGGETGFAHAGGVGEGPAGGPVNDGAWHHFVAISDKDAVNFGTALYIDGVQYTRFDGAPNLATNGKRVMIGENPDARGREWEGELDDIAIWDRVLTEAEIGQLKSKALSELLGAIVKDSDNDGMPDDFEIANGFNPLDRTDAAKDFDGDGVSNLDEYKAGTNPSDITKPTIVASVASPTFDSISLTLSEDVDPATVVAGNFTITPSLAVSAVSYAKKVVTLTTAAQAPGGTGYTVAVKGLKDTSKNEIATGTTVTVYSYLLTKSGVIRMAIFENIQGGIDNIYADERYPASPTRVGALFSFNSRDLLPTDSLEQYGAVMEGFITPTENASYRFFVYSDDASQLYLSTDDKEANLALIAEESGCCNNFTEPDSPRTSEPIALVAGRKYFIRMVYKEGGGGDYGQVAWRKEGDTTPAGTLRPISGAFLSSAVDLPAPAQGTLLTQSPAANAKGVSPTAVVRVAHNDGKAAWTAANVSMKFDGAPVTPVFTKAGSVATIVYTPSALLGAASVHTVALTYPDPGGNPATMEWSFTVADYPTLTTSHKAVSFDATKPGFVWNVFQNETFTHTSLKQTEDALAGKLMNGTTPVTDNLADPAARGPALADGVKVNNLYKFEIATVINLSQTADEANGNFPADAQMPGIPGTSGGNDGIDAEVITFVELPAGAVTMGVNSDDGFRAQAGYINVPADGAVLGQFDGGRGASDTLFTFAVASAGVYPIRVIWNEGGGGANIEFFSVKADGTKVLVNDTANGGFKAYRVGVAPAKPAGAPKISVARNANGSLTVTFEGTLEVADSVTGPWTVQAGTSPLTLPASGAMKYARSKF